MATSTIKNPFFMIQRDTDFANLTVPAGQSLEVPFTNPAINGYNRPILIILDVHGTNSSFASMQIHGGVSDGSVWIYNAASTNATVSFKLRLIYVKDSYISYQNINA